MKKTYLYTVVTILQIVPLIMGHGVAFKILLFLTQHVSELYFCLSILEEKSERNRNTLTKYLCKILNETCFKYFYHFVGITTLVGGGTGPADGTRATTCTPAPSQMKLMLQSTDDLPLNFGFTGKVNL